MGQCSEKTRGNPYRNRRRCERENYPSDPPLHLSNSGKRTFRVCVGRFTRKKCKISKMSQTVGASGAGADFKHTPRQKRAVPELYSAKPRSFIFRPKPLCDNGKMASSAHQASKAA